MSRELALAHMGAQRRLKTLAADGLGRAWDDLPSYNEADVAPFLRRAVPFVVGTQRQSVALTNAFLARSLEQRPTGVNIAAIVAGIRNGASAADVYRRPFVDVWSGLKNGKAWTDAVAAGRARLVSAAEMDIQLAMRDTLLAVGETEEALTGYQRVANANACEFCLAVNGAQFQTEVPMALHNGCDCGFEAITYTRISKQEFPKDVTVEDHGELGPVLVDPSQQFTSL